MFDTEVLKSNQPPGKGLSLTVLLPHEEPSCHILCYICVSHSESVWIFFQTEVFKPPDWISQI